MLAGDNSILSQAGRAREKTDESTREEQRRLTMLEAASNVNGENYNGVKIPAGYAPTKIKGESTVDEGLAITDSEGNEYVWIEVPNDGTGPVYTAVTSEEDNSDEYYRAIAAALRTYCTKDASGGDLIKDGDVINGFLVTVTTTENKTTYRFSKPDPYKYSIKEEDGNIISKIIIGNL